ncbi:complement receptor type 2 [Xenentodon cancila]
MEIVLDTRGQRKLKSLLLIYLFIVNAAAECPRPQGSGNMILSNEALLMNEFPDSSDVTLVCANGYVQESGSGIMSCIDQKWTEPDLICKKKDCGLPPPQPNMNFNTSEGTLFGATVQVYCDTGYLITGSSYRQCFAFGWSGNANCEIVTCEAPPEIQNGRSSWDPQENPKYGENISYHCNEGFTLVGELNIMCMDTGEYNSSAPECKGECPRPQGSENMILSNEALLMNEFPDGSDVTLLCANGYDKESGSGIMSCVDQKWTKPDLICKKKDCGLPPKQPNMNFDLSEGTLFGATVGVFCDEGYHISGSSYKHCFAFGWTGKANCKIVTCEKPPEIQNGKSSWDSPENPKYGENISYHCNEGFTLVGEINIMCMDTGEYSSSAPECKAECPRPQGSENMILSNEALLMTEFPDGSDVTLLCANGYDKESGSGIMSCVDQKWTKPDLICKKKDCGLPPKQPNMNFDLSEGTLFGATVGVFCDEGYHISGYEGFTLVGKLNIICMDTGEYSSSATECKDMHDQAENTNMDIGEIV